MIADERRALAMAGVMGGRRAVSGSKPRSSSSRVHSSPRTQLPGRARRYGFGSDASHRYERGVDFELSRHAIERATRLVLDICGGEAGPVEEAVRHRTCRCAPRCVCVLHGSARCSASSWMTPAWPGSWRGLR